MIKDDHHFKINFCPYFFMIAYCELFCFSSIIRLLIEKRVRDIFVKEMILKITR